MDNPNLENAHEDTFNIFHYIKENFLGLLLFSSVFFIIYFVDYINRLNMLINPVPSPIPGLTTVISSTQKISKRKFKKR